MHYRGMHVCTVLVKVQIYEPHNFSPCMELFKHSGSTWSLVKSTLIVQLHIDYTMGCTNGYKQCGLADHIVVENVNKIQVL